MRKYIQKIKSDLNALRIALRENLVPWHVKLLIVITIAYAFSPVDLIPDFIPILGLLDDLIILPLMIFLIVKLIPDETIERCRQQAESEKFETKKNWVAGAVIILVWLAALAGLWYWWKTSKPRQ